MKYVISTQAVIEYYDSKTYKRCAGIKILSKQNTKAVLESMKKLKDYQSFIKKYGEDLVQVTKATTTDGKVTIVLYQEIYEQEGIDLIRIG